MVMEPLFVGIDPSFRGLGLSDGRNHCVVKTAAGEHLDDRIGDLLDAISNFVFERDGAVTTVWLLVEAPLLRVVAIAPKDGHSSPPPDGSHLYELGNLMRAIRYELVDELREQGLTVIYLEVGIGTLRHFMTGCGGAAKENVPYMIEQIWGVRIEKDPGLDKLMAWSLVQYGRAVYAREETHIFAATRGQGKHARRNARKARRTRSAGAA